MTNFRTYHLAVEFYRLVRPLEIDNHLKNQLLRASSSIALNLAEGDGRSTQKDRANFYRISFGSLRECQAILELAEVSPLILEQADKLAAHLFRLIANCQGE